MKNKGVGVNSHVVISRVESSDIFVTVHCQDRTAGATEVEKTMTFKERGHQLFPKDYRDDYMRAYRQIEGWLLCMGINDACHGHVIHEILKCSNSNILYPLVSLKLDVYIELTDVSSALYLHEEKPTPTKM